MKEHIKYKFAGVMNTIVEYKCYFEGATWSMNPKDILVTPEKVLPVTFENEYYDSPSEAKLAWFNNISNNREKEIRKLEVEIKKKRIIIDQAKKQIDYDKILKDHPDLLV